MEYMYACSLHKPVIACIRNNIDSLPISKTEDNKIKRKKLQNFRQNAKNMAEVQFWDNESDLCAKVLVSLHNAFIYQPRPGLIPFSAVDECNQGLVDEIDELRMKLGTYLTQVNTLRRENAKLVEEIENLYRFSKCIYVQTRSGERITMPSNATALDFAFYIHKMVGLCTKGIFVTPVGSQKPQLVPFSYRLRAGDTVNVISESGADGRPIHIHATSKWMRHLRTDRAKKILKQAIDKGLI